MSFLRAFGVLLLAAWLMTMLAFAFSLWWLLGIVLSGVVFWVLAVNNMFD